MALTRQSFKVVAYAGAGKTTTLNLIGNQLRGRGIYLAFNSDCFQKPNVNSPPCRLSYFSLIGISSYRSRYHRKAATTAVFSQSPRPQIWADPCANVKRQIEGKSQFVTLTPERQARFVSDAVSTFCSTHASYPAPRHLQFPDWLVASEAEQLRDTLYQYVERRWQQSIDLRHPCGDWA